ncbi:hypothetical protein chiPu_0004696 [Chiloscyllium punctatum]|uniref:Uncharacterized protein n=1 Tax=Chiloscyllium punctatum TaxID=137246 RepID=A0A401S7C9_CHIPU|nr:hypothetical protein [Chiloscyllium punctatum]
MGGSRRSRVGSQSRREPGTCGRTNQRALLPAPSTYQEPRCKSLGARAAFKTKGNPDFKLLMTNPSKPTHVPLSLDRW